MKDARLWEEIVRQLSDAHPPGSILLTAAPQRASPQIDDMEAEGNKRATIGRHRVVVEVPRNDLLQPSSLFRDRLMHAQPQLPFDLLKLRPHAVATGFPLDEELASSRFAANVGEAEETEGLRFAEPAPLVVLRRETSELDQPGLLGMQRQRELPRPDAHRVQE